MAEGDAPKGGNQAGLKGLVLFLAIVGVTAILIFASWAAFKDYVGEDVPLMQVQVTLTDGELDIVNNRWITEVQSYAPYIVNASSDIQVAQTMIDPLDSPGDASWDLADRPAVVVYCFNMDNNWNTGKASVHYTSPGTYSFNISFSEPPVKGDRIKVVVEVVYDKIIYAAEDIFPLYNIDQMQSSIIYEWE